MNTQFQTTNFKCVASFNDTLTSGVEFLDCSEVQLEKFDLPRDNDWVVVETDCIWRTIHEGSRESPDFVLQELAAKRQSAYIAAKGILG